MNEEEIKYEEKKEEIQEEEEEKNEPSSLALWVCPVDWKYQNSYDSHAPYV